MHNVFVRGVTLALAVATVALTSQTVSRNVRYNVTFQQLNSNQPLYSGNLLLDFSKGTISGTYTDTSISPRGPMNNRRNVPVSGGLNPQGHITLVIGPLTFRGTVSGDSFSGTATSGARVFTFKAHPGWPGHPAP